jgi:preprotein translocase subunit SecG
VNILSGILTVVLTANCVLLIFLVLIQLPKKDAGAGMAFGGGAADALFGAGSGNVLTKITKWATGIFFAIALILGLSEVSAHRGNAPAFQKALEQKQAQLPGQIPVGVPSSTPAPAAPTTATNSSPTSANPPGNAPAPPQNQ